jgi:hypothetical protein
MLLLQMPLRRAQCVGLSPPVIFSVASLALLRLSSCI